MHPFFGINFGTGDGDARLAPPGRRSLTTSTAPGGWPGAWASRLGYHNHNWEFFRLTDDPSLTAFDVLIEETDPRYVHFELDLFWSWRGRATRSTSSSGIDGRVRQYHVKDINQAGSFDDLRRRADRLRADLPCRSQVDEYIVERDDAGTRTPAQALDTASVGYEYLANLRLRRRHRH